MPIRVARRCRDSEQGAVAIIVAASLTMILVAAALVLDFGIVRLDRQTNKAAADSAAAAGLQAMDSNAQYNTNGQFYAFQAVCTALTTLKANQPDLSSLNFAACGDSTLLSKPCRAHVPATHADFSSTIGSYRVEIRSPYEVSEGDFPEEDLPTLSGDVGDPTLGGCDQIAVIVTQSRQPGLGSLATSSDLVSRVRTVGRALLDGENKGAVALLLLERDDCGVLTANGSGSVLVQGNGAQPGMIHVDSLARNVIDINGDGVSDASGTCNSVNAISGGHPNSIVAEPSVSSPQKPGIITVRALGGEAGAVAGKASDGSPKVRVLPDPPNVPTGRRLVSREPVDDRWLYGVTAAVTSSTNYARATVPLPAPGPAVTYETNCTGAAGPSAATKTQTDTVVFNCADAGKNYPNVTLQANRVIFAQGVYVSAELKMPNATEIYVRGVPGGNAIDVRNAGSLQIHTAGRTAVDANYVRPICASTNLPGRAKLIVGAGSLNATADGGHLQLCHTTVIMMGNTADACLPLSIGTPPTINACDSFININGGLVDWTAPDEVGGGADSDDWNELEDLALWTEAEDTSASTKHRIVGGGAFRLAGVFMVPNGNDFTIGGNGGQHVENSQYVARRLTVAGTGVLNMSPDPNDSFTIPYIDGWVLVR